MDFGPSTFAQPVAGVIHTVVDALTQAALHREGRSVPEQRFVGKSKQIVSFDMPAENLASFEADIRDLLGHWKAMSIAERSRNKITMRDVRDAVNRRYGLHGTTRAPLQVLVNQAAEEVSLGAGR